MSAPRRRLAGPTPTSPSSRSTPLEPPSRPVEFTASRPGQPGLLALVPTVEPRRPFLGTTFTYRHVFTAHETRTMLEPHGYRPFPWWPTAHWSTSGRQPRSRSMPLSPSLFLAGTPGQGTRRATASPIFRVRGSAWNADHAPSQVTRTADGSNSIPGHGRPVRFGVVADGGERRSVDIAEPGSRRCRSRPGRSPGWLEFVTARTRHRWRRARVPNGHRESADGRVTCDGRAQPGAGSSTRT
jgi:hypothetical protein